MKKMLFFVLVFFAPAILIAQQTTYPTAWFAEYQSTGPGANAAGRVAWSHQLTDDEAKIYYTKIYFPIKTTGILQ